MPEGHTIHRLANRHRNVFGGDVVRAWSPQGRFSDGAAAIDGAVLEDTAAYGKHVFYEFGGDLLLHVHLGLIGTFRTYTDELPAPGASTRLALSNESVAAYLVGPMTCRLVTRTDVEVIVDDLGPDPLRRGARGKTVFRENLAKRRIPIGAALLEQRVVAGIGNVYRSEMLFKAGIHPDVPANAIASDDADLLWDVIVAELRHGLRLGRIVTVEPAELGVRSRARIDRGDRLYAYQRDGLPCRRCGTEIRVKEMAGRSIWWCPSDQAR